MSGSRWACRCSRVPRYFFITTRSHVTRHTVTFSNTMHHFCLCIYVSYVLYRVQYGIMMSCHVLYPVLYCCLWSVVTYSSATGESKTKSKKPRDSDLYIYTVYPRISYCVQYSIVPYDIYHICYIIP